MILHCNTCEGKPEMKHIDVDEKHTIGMKCPVCGCEVTHSECENY